MKTLVVISLLAASILVGGAAVNKQYFNCDKRFLCIDYTPAKPG